jgi:tetratricopeptide (TPR) repeat protein
MNNMKKINLLAMLFCMISATVFAQKSKVNAAIFSLEEGKLTEAKQQIDEALKDAETQATAKAWQTKGDIYKGLYENITLFPQNPNALFEAKDAYMKAYELETNPKKKNEVGKPLTTLTDFFKNEAVSAYQNEKYDVASKQFSQAMAINNFLREKGMTKDLDTSAIFGTAIAAFNAKMMTEALPLLEKLVELGYNHVAPYEYLATYYESKDDPKLSDFLEKGLAKYPDNSILKTVELNYNISHNKVDESIKKLQAALQKEPNNATMLFSLAGMYEQQKQYPTALMYYEKAIKAKPNYADAYTNAGAVYYNQAVEINKIINAENNNTIDSFLAVLGKQELFTIAEVEAVLKDKNYGNLLSSFANVSDVAAFKDKVAKMNDMIKYDLLQGSRNVLFNKALPYLEKSYEIDPKTKGIYSALKEIYARMNMLDKAAALKEQ